MRMPDSLAERILLDSGVIDNDRLLELKAEVKSTHVPLVDLAVHYGILSEEDLAKAFAKELGLPYVDLVGAALHPAHLNVLPEHMSRRHRIVVFDITPDQTRLVASDSPIRPQAQEVINKALGANYKLHLTTPDSLHAALDAYRQHRFISQVEAPNGRANDSYRVLQTIQHILEEAIYKGASSIHIEPKSDVITVRFRIDGVLKEYYKLPIKVASVLNDRLKAMASLGSIGPQEGQFKISSHSLVYRVEVLTLPVVDGDKITLNLFNESLSAPNLRTLGLWGNNLETLERVALSSRGLVLVSGPRNSGKVIHLYGALSELKLGNINVLTIEDKLSYRLPGASQLTLGSALPSYEVAINAALKQDPEVLLIDKVLSADVANKIVDASSNSLVLSGIHSNNVYSSLSYLMHLGIEPYRLAHHTNLILSVRSVRKLCEECKQEVHPTNEVLRGIIKALSVSSIGGIKGLHNLEKQAASEGLGSKGELSTTDSHIKRFWQAKNGGCVHCNYAGYKGKLYLQEVVSLNDSLKAKLAAGVTETEFYSLALKNGSIPLKIDGLVKALRGLTSVDEVTSIS